MRCWYPKQRPNWQTHMSALEILLLIPSVWKLWCKFIYAIFTLLFKMLPLHLLIFSSPLVSPSSFHIKLSQCPISKMCFLLLILSCPLIFWLSPVENIPFPTPLCLSNFVFFCWILVKLILKMFITEDCRLTRATGRGGEVQQWSERTVSAGGQGARVGCSLLGVRGDSLLTPLQAFLPFLEKKKMEGWENVTM